MLKAKSGLSPSAQVEHVKLTLCVCVCDIPLWEMTKSRQPQSCDHCTHSYAEGESRLDKQLIELNDISRGCANTDTVYRSKSAKLVH